MTPLLLAVPLLLAAPVPKDFKKPDAEALVGTWEIVESSSNNGPDPNSVGLKYRLEAGGGCAIVSKDGKTATPLVCTFDPAAKPKLFLWDRGPASRWNGVYELTGDRLVMAFPNRPSDPAPDTAGPASGVMCNVLRRVKE